MGAGEEPRPRATDALRHGRLAPGTGVSGVDLGHGGGTRGVAAVRRGEEGSRSGSDVFLQLTRPARTTGRRGRARGVDHRGLGSAATLPLGSASYGEARQF